MQSPPGGPVVDAHLDMAGNVLIGRDYTRSATEVRAAEEGRPGCMVTLPELREAGVAVACGTLFVGTVTYEQDGTPVYKEPPDESARQQLDVYRRWEDEGLARIIRTATDLEEHLKAWDNDGVLGVVVLIEGGDSIRTPDDLPWWWEAGVRIVGPAWSGTRYAGGTKRPGGLTPAGRDLVAGMRDLGIVLDASHLAEQSFWDAMEVGPGRVIASHSNARALVPGDRQLSDEMIAAIAERDGVIGLNMYNAFLVDGWEPGQQVGLDAVRSHAEHIASIAGWHRIGIGSDLDGGLGVEQTPAELRSAADLPRLSEVAPEEARSGVLGGNWLRFLREVLPR